MLSQSRLKPSTTVVAAASAAPPRVAGGGVCGGTVCDAMLRMTVRCTLAGGVGPQVHNL